MKNVALLLALTFFSATAAFAAEGTVKSVNDDKIAVEMSDTAKLKKGSSVKINGKAGKITAMDGKNITIKANKPTDLKAGETVKVDKVNDMQGC